MDIKDLAGKTVKRGLGRWDEDNDREDWGIEFTDGTIVYFSATPYTTGSVDVNIVESSAHVASSEGVSD